MYDITSHIATIVIFAYAAYARFGRQVEELYSVRYRTLCENYIEM